MFQNKYVFAQLTAFLNRTQFNNYVRKYDGNRYVKHFTCWNQLLAMMFGQLSNRESLRDLIVAFEAHRAKQWKVMEQDVCECKISGDNAEDEIAKHMATRKDLLLKNFQDASNTLSDRPDTWHLNKTSGYIKVNGKIMSYAYNANCMNQFAIEYISEHLGEKTGWVIMDFAGLGTKEYESPVYGDELLKILLQNNYAMVKSGVLK